MGSWVNGSHLYVICDYAIAKESMLRRSMLRGSYIEVSFILEVGSSVEFVPFRAIVVFPARPLLMGQGENPKGKGRLCEIGEPAPGLNSAGVKISENFNLKQG